LWQEINQWALDREIELPVDALKKYDMYFQMLTDANKRFNLTRITDSRDVLIKHFMDSLEILSWRDISRETLLDIGSGAGFPGIPLKIACPEMTLIMLDSSQKRVLFLQQVIEQIGLKNTSVFHGRAEDLARKSQYRENFMYVLSRALARLPVLLELCLPFVNPRGYFVAYKGPDTEQELAEAGEALMQLRGMLAEHRSYVLPDGMGMRSLLIFKKNGRTPARFPRKAGLPAKKPLGAS
jgi:16S rRNA (guanine527-N7)-methyltransferase